MLKNQMDMDFEVMSTVDFQALSNIQLPDPSLLSFYENLNDRTLVLNDNVTDDLLDWATYIIQWNKESIKLKLTKDEATPIKIYINSDGGNIEAILPIIDLIRASRVKVITIGLGKCFSAGALLLMSGDERYALPNTQVLIHEGATGYYGDVGKVKDRVEFEQQIDLRLAEHIVSCTDISEDEYNANARRDWWMFADEAKEKGVIDDIITDLSVLAKIQ